MGNDDDMKPVFWKPARPGRSSQWIGDPVTFLGWSNTDPVNSQKNAFFCENRVTRPGWLVIQRIQHGFYGSMETKEKPKFP